MSPYRLIFNTNSSFEEVSDVHLIARSEETAINLCDLLTNPQEEQEFDIVGVLVEVEEPKEITKGDRNLTLCNWVIADPTTRVTVHAAFWNDRIRSDPSWIGRTILMGRFFLRNHNGSVTIGPKSRSSVQPVTEHPYQRLEG